ncbi:hypothetical protein O6H91_10G028200 [Diphasiastrum complanatum]|uniref:Uncharacterized protein n=1 Tax=Diphasiastrum complanatum TaxID=34168 RepID=A0ACC2CFN4_DIPCM|nr:hypothetical protein O6H91_10G028200 [Diphasiastrum complanatum]
MGDGDGDLGAVVWGVASAPSPAFGLQQPHSDHATMILGTSSTWAQSVVHSRSGAAMDMTRLRNSSSDSKSVEASSSLPSLFPQTHASSSIKVTSLDRCGGTLSELIGTLGAGNNSATVTGELSTSASVSYSNISSDNRSSLYAAMILEKAERSTSHEVRSIPQVLSCTSFEIAGNISSMIDESLHFGAWKLFPCPSPTSFEGPAFEECARLSLLEEANLRIAMTGKSLDPSTQPMEIRASMESPSTAPKAIEGKQGSKRRLQQKRIVHVPVSGGGRPSGEVLPSDMWAWRKYGQKPIKGSPYPRGYYRCSSSKGCGARKQVERSQTDPSMLIITYTSEHNHSWPVHRNSLAGTTRPKSSPEKSVATFCSDVATHPPHHSSGSITNTDASQTCLSGNTSLLGAADNIALGQDSGNLETISRSSTQEEDLFPALDGVPEFSSALRKNVLDERSDDEGGNVEVDPYNLFCWSSGGLPAC